MLNTTENKYNVYDCAKGTVIARSKKGIYLELDNGETAFAPFAPLADGTKVLCTIRKRSSSYWHLLATVDSVLDDRQKVA